MRIADVPESRLIAEIDESVGRFSRQAWHMMDTELPCELDRLIIDQITAPGKRIRPVYCLYGATHDPDVEISDELLGVAASLELFHSFALIHDDIMDKSETRRGRPSLHVAIRGRLSLESTSLDPESRAESLAILAGDLVLAWADWLFTESTAGFGADVKAAARRVFDMMKMEIVTGQALDVRYERSPLLTPDITSRIVELKTARYTFVRPMQIGAALFGHESVAFDRCREVGTHLGAAFQLNDDLLGSFLCGEESGKSSSSDIEVCKPTELLRYMLANASDEDRGITDIITRPGDEKLSPDEVDAVRGLMLKTGAVQHVVDRIKHETRLASRAVDTLDVPTEVKNRMHAYCNRIFASAETHASTLAAA